MKIRTELIMALFLCLRSGSEANGTRLVRAIAAAKAHPDTPLPLYVLAGRAEQFLMSPSDRGIRAAAEQSLNEELQQEKRRATQPIVCPNCGELSASPIVCDYCREAIPQKAEEAA